MAPEAGKTMASRCARPLRLALAAAALAASACTNTQVFHHDRHETPAGGDARILLMPPDVELSELTIAGLPEPRADWTGAALGHLDVALREHLERLGEEIVPYAPTDRAELQRSHTQLLKLHEVVGSSILEHQLGPPALRLPTLGKRFDWTLGEEARALSAESGAQYALFVFVRDSYTSAGRAVMMFTAAAVAGVALPGGRQIGFASLVDLASGDLVWFNFLTSETGDLRDLDSARDTVRALLEELPR